ncbi:hypothetical protein [Desulfofarcimen acetoxidans]|uniref:hypothetical protein n=1 Tax=Desulfofarcimen acetoxidans TaxID=58138 RepID=UPI001389F057|nr:hypothetical protein [Desulfofarcimen acetoxidans]
MQEAMKHVNLTLEVLPAAKAAFQLTRSCFDCWVKDQLIASILDQLTGKGWS